jgi:hypothetical protein
MAFWARVYISRRARITPCCADFVAHVVVIRNVEVAALQHGPSFVDGTNRQLGLPWCPQLAHQHHIELAQERVRDGPSHGHSTAGHTQDQRILPLVRRQSSGQLLGCLVAILEMHDITPNSTRENTQRTQSKGEGEALCANLLPA